MTDPDWRVHAVCRAPGIDSDLWFENLAEAAAICRRFCVVRAECLDVALAAEGATPAKSRFGVWGGLTPGRRYAEYRRRQKAQASGDPPGTAAA